MSKPEWGAKRLCQTCGTKFYDLLRSPIICPRCGAEFGVEAAQCSRRFRPVASATVMPAEPERKPVPVDEIEVDEDVEVHEDVEVDT